MPAVSKSQARYMCGVCHGSIEPKGGLSKLTACEYCTSQKGLPEKKGRRKNAS
jgi:hypothetical protein